MKNLLVALLCLSSLSLAGQTGVFVTHSTDLQSREASWRNGIGINRFMKNRPLIYAIGFSGFHLFKEWHNSDYIPVADLHTDSTFTLYGQGFSIARYDFRASLQRTFSLGDAQLLIGMEVVCGLTKAYRFQHSATYLYSQEHNNYLGNNLAKRAGPPPFSAALYRVRQHYLNWGAAPMLGLLLTPGQHWQMQVNFKPEWIRRIWLKDTETMGDAMNPMFNLIPNDRVLLLEWKLGYRFG